MSIPGDFDPSLQKKVKQMSGQFQASHPRSENHAIYGSKAMVDDDRPAFVSPLSLVAGLTVSDGLVIRAAVDHDSGIRGSSSDARPD